MSESLIIKNGSGVLKKLQVDSGSYGYISNHALVSTVTGSNVYSYSPYAGWDWSSDDGVVNALPLSQDRKSVIINNNSLNGKCYVLVGSSSFGTIPDITKAPPKYSFLLDSGGTYFGDSSTSALSHVFYIPSASSLINSEAITITVTEIY